MATPDTAPWVYNFKYSYYENFYRNRVSQFSQSGSFYDMFHDNWELNDLVVTVDGVSVNHGVDIRYYVQKHFNGDTPECLVEKIKREIDEWLDSTAGIVIDILGGGVLLITRWISETIKKLVKKFFNAIGSFICTASVSVLGPKDGNKYLNKLKNYLDSQVPITDSGTEMFKYYTVIGPKIIKAIEADTDRDTVYKYIFAEYIIKLDKLIDEDNKDEVLNTYFRMLDDLVKRYNIKTTKRYKKWLQNWI